MTESLSLVSLVVTTTDAGESWLSLEANPHRLLTILDADPAEPADVQELMQMLQLKLSLDWLHKIRHNPRHRIDVSKRIATPIRPFGVLLCSAFNICQVLAARSRLTDLEIFAPVASELFHLCFKCPGGRDASVKRLRATVKKLRDNSNPFDKGDYPYLAQWWCDIQGLFNNPEVPNFTAKYLHRRKVVHDSELGFYPALQGWILALRQSQFSYLKHDDQSSLLLFQEGRGKHLLRVPPDEVKQKLILEFFQGKGFRL